MCFLEPDYLRYSYEIIVDVAVRYIFDCVTLYFALINGATKPAHAVVS